MRKTDSLCFPAGAGNQLKARGWQHVSRSYAMTTRATQDSEGLNAQRDKRTCALLAKAERLPAAEARQVRQEAILLNGPLAQALARQYRRRGIEDDDLEQVAMLGLCKAVQGYHPHGDEASFAAFAVPTITGELKRHFRDHGWLVRPTRELQEVGQSVRHALPTLTQRLQRQPSRRELAEHLGISAKTIAQAMLAQGLYQGWSLDVPAGESTTSLCDTLPDANDAFAPVEAALTIGPAVSRLTPRERTILRLRFLEDLTQGQIGELIGVSQMQVSRLLADILVKLRMHIDNKQAA
ncbi:MAG: sigma-70 family RNA polymerase sigma factor [Actinomycetota bacterium]